MTVVKYSEGIIEQDLDMMSAVASDCVSDKLLPILCKRKVPFDPKYD